MYGSWIRLGLAGFLVACSLPLLAVSFLVAALGAAGAALFPFFRLRRREIESKLQESSRVDEFAFDRAIESYEALIDAHAMRLHTWRHR